jgi:hypothetical protein
LSILTLANFWAPPDLKAAVVRPNAWRWGGITVYKAPLVSNELRAGALIYRAHACF